MDNVSFGSTNLYYYRARYYSPRLGRFLQTDPVGTKDDFNLYAYVRNDSPNNTDPSGRDPGDRAFGISFGFLHTPEENELQARAEAAAGNFQAAEGVAAGEAIASGAADYKTGTPAVAVIGTVAGKIADDGIGGRKGKASGPATQYKRPSGATTRAQRESVQGKPCVKCGAETPRQVAGHKEPLVKEHYETGTIDKDRMRSVDAVQPECPTCSAREGAEMRQYSIEKKKEHGL